MKYRQSKYIHVQLSTLRFQQDKVLAYICIWMRILYSAQYILRV